MKADILDFLAWMDKSKICACIPFFALQAGRDPKIPVWTNGEKLFNANELYDLFHQQRKHKK